MLPDPSQHILTLLDAKEARRHLAPQLRQLATTHLVVGIHVPRSDDEYIAEFELRALPLCGSFEISK